MTLSRAQVEHSLRERFGSFGAFRYRLQVRAYHLRLSAMRLLDRAIGRGRFTFGEPISVDEDPQTVSNFVLLHPAENILLGDPERESFLRICQFVQNGRIYRPSVFVCEVASAKLFPRMGLVFNARWQPVVESILDRERLSNFKRLLRPRRTSKRLGTYSSIQHLWHFRNWHWMADSIPQIYSLAQYMQGRPLTLLMPAMLGEAERESLECILPSNFAVEYVDPDEWLEVENFVLPSHVSSRANAFLPPAYFEFIRSKTLQSLGIASPERAAGRYYLSRSRAKHRRVLNEPELVGLLEEFGFETVLLEECSFRRQVELFVHAGVVVSPHSAALGSLMYGDALKLCILYPEAHPATYFYTLARGLGQEHFYLTGNQGENDDFRVDLARLRQILTEEMRLSRVGRAEGELGSTDAIADITQAPALL